MSLTQLLIQVAARGTLLLLLTLLAAQLFRRSSAATRHLIWTGGLVASLIVPLISVSEPALPVLPSAPFVQPSSVPSVEPASVPAQEAWSGTIIDPAPSQPAVRRVSGPDETAGADIDWPRILGLTWLLGLALVSLKLVAGWIAIARLERRAVAVTAPEWLSTIRSLKSVHSSRVIRYLESSEVSTPCTWGTLAPTVLLPAVGTEWSPEERRQVVVHELAHVRRFDCATQILTTLAVALNWFNPLAWYAQRQSRVAREQACDDAVLVAGGMASTYAGLLLTAAAPEGGPWLPSEAQAMARRSQIGDRLLAVLDPARRRNPVDRRSIGWLSASTFAIAIPVVSIGFRPAVAPESLRAGTAAEAIGSRTHADSVTPEPVTSSSTPASLASLGTTGVATDSAGAESPSRVTAEPPDVCDLSKRPGKESSSSSSYSDEDGDERRNFYTVRWSGADCSARIEGKGKVVFNASEDDVVSLTDGGRFEIETDVGSTTRHYKVTSKNGSLERRYQVNDKDATFDEEGLKWRAALVLEFIRRTGYDAEARAARIRKRGGMDALVTEIAALRGDGVRAIYIKVALSEPGVSAGDATRLLVLARQIGSDGDKAAVLKALPVALLSNSDVQRAYADAAGSIGSDGDLAMVIKSAIVSNQLTANSCEWVLGLTDNIGSDGDKSSVLMTATDVLQWNSSCVRKSLEVTRDIGSDGDKSATLIRFLKRHKLPSELVPIFFETASTIGSSGDHSSVLHRVIDLSNNSDVVVEGLLKDSRRINSDGDHASVLIAAAQRGIVRTEKLKALYRESARGIGSNGDREAAIQALERS